MAATLLSVGLSSGTANAETVPGCASAKSHTYRVSNWIAVIDGNEEYPGGDLRSGNKQELWDAGAATLDKCTRAASSVTVPGGGYVSGWTDLRC